MMTGTSSNPPPRWKASAWYLLASVPFTVAFLLIPADLYVRGQEYLSLDLHPLLVFAAIGLLLYMIAALLISGMARLRAGIGTCLAGLLFCAGTFILISDVYFPPQIGPLDGSLLSAEEPLLASVLEAAILLALAFVFVKLIRGKLVNAAALFSAAVLVVAAGYGAAAVWQTRGARASGESAAVDAPQAVHPTSSAGNVYHIVLDAMQTDAFLLALEKNQLAQDFSGFTVYRNNMANYLVTTLSLPSYITGTFYHKGNLKGWQMSWPDRSLFKRLSDENFRTSMYAPRENWNNRYVDRFVLDLDVYEQETNLVQGDLADFLQVWFARLAPNILTGEALALSREVRGRVGGALGATGDEIPVATEDGTKPYAGVLMIRQAIRDEEARSPRGEYVYLHTILPHSPFVMDGECRYDGEQDKTSTAAYLAQAECAAKLLVEFFDHLKRLGRYEAATIVVHGDHGLFRGFFAEPEPGRPSAQPAGGDAAVRLIADDGEPEWLAKVGLDAARWDEFKGHVAKNSRALASRARALLMIKPPHAGGELTVSDEPSQLVDIFPTLLDLLGIDPPEHHLHGRSLVGSGETYGREARFGIVHERYTKEIIEVRMNRQTDLWSSDLTVIGPATEPRLWREELRSGLCRGADDAASRMALLDQGARIVVEEGSVSETGTRPLWCEAHRDRR